MLDSAKRLLEFMRKDGLPDECINLASFEAVGTAGVGFYDKLPPPDTDDVIDFRLFAEVPEDAE